MARRRLWIAAIAVLLLLALAFVGLYVQAGNSDSPQRIVFGLRLPWRSEPTLTATPTKTPAAEDAATPTPTPLQSLPTLTATATGVAMPTPTATAELPPALTAATPTPTQTPAPPLPAELTAVAQAHGIDPTGRFVVVDQNEQQMYVVDDDKRLRTLPVSTGNPDSNFSTPGWSGLIGGYWGSFSAGGAWADNAWYLFTLNGGGTILVHSAPYTLENGIRTYQELDALGLYPASRGCIRLRPEDAQWFSDWQPEGTPIVILPWDGGTARQG